jgi:ATP synthase protein I
MDLTIPRVLMWQFVVGAVLAAILWAVFGTVAGYSALLGSLTCVIPNGFLGLRIMAPRRDPGALMKAAWIGEIGKLALTVLLFVLVFTQVKPLSAAALFAGFIVTQLVVFSGFLMRGDTDTDKENTNGS